MAIKPLRVGIVGAGFAGCSAALNLAQRGVSVTLLEAASTPGPVGQGIGLQPVGLSALHRMQQPGLLEDVLAHGARINGIRSWSLRGGEPSVVLDVEYARFDPRMYGLGVGRGVLFSALYERACADAAVDVHVGAAVGELRERESGVELLRPGPEGDSLGLYDLVVLADGARSALRAAHGVPSVVRRYGYGALYALLPDPDGVTDHWLSQVHSKYSRSVATARRSMPAILTMAKFTMALAGPCWPRRLAHAGLPAHRPRVGGVARRQGGDTLLLDAPRRPPRSGLLGTQCRRRHGVRRQRAARLVRRGRLPRGVSGADARSGGGAAAAQPRLSAAARQLQ